MLALFDAPPPQATQPPPRLSLCLHTCAGHCASDDDFPLLSSPSRLQVRVRGARRPASEAAATTAAATGGGGVATP